MKPLATSLRGASEYTGIPEATLRLKIRKGDLSARKVGRRIVVFYSDLTKLLNAGAK